MRILLPLVAAAAFAAFAASPAVAAERRCGWLDNPTPANWWLTDRDGEWTLGAQGGWQAPGLDDLPDMRARGWIGDPHGYGRACACMNVDTDARTRHVTRIYSARPVPLRQCRADPRLRGR